MRRGLLFLLLLLVFVVLTFPHGMIVDRFVAARLRAAGVQLEIGDVSPAWPPGYDIEDVVMRRGALVLRLDKVHVDLSLDGSINFDADGCGGVVRGSYRTEGEDDEGRFHPARVEATFSGIDPSTCLQTGPLVLAGTFGGVLQLDGVGKGDRASVLGAAAESGRLTMAGSSGTIAGELPRPPSAVAATPASTGQPIGSWEFEHAELEARIDGRDLLVESAAARAEGISWSLDGLRFSPMPGARARLAGELRARRLDDSPRARAVLGILPKAGEGRDGWRHYRIGGTLGAPKLIGLR